MSVIFFPSDHPYLTVVHEDRLRPSWAPLATVNHSSCGLVEWCKLRIMRGLFLPLGEWFTSLARRTGFAVVCLLFVSYSIYPVYALGGSCGVHYCVVLGVTMANDIIYRGLFPVGNLNNKKPSWGKYHNLSCMMNDPTSPVGRKIVIHMSHRMCRSRRCSDQKV